MADLLKPKTDSFITPGSSASYHVSIKSFAPVPSKSSPKNDYYFFGYNVVIRNNSSEEVQVIGRHWIIRDGNKRERFINGEGIIGQRPKIEAGEEFTYQSFCPLSTPTGNMRGKYEVIVGARKFWVRRNRKK